MHNTSFNATDDGDDDDVIYLSASLAAIACLMVYGKVSVALM